MPAAIRKLGPAFKTLAEMDKTYISPPEPAPARVPAQKRPPPPPPAEGSVLYAIFERIISTCRKCGSQFMIHFQPGSKRVCEGGSLRVLEKKPTAATSAILARLL
uniref:Uncharacterized protein n=1 Tax=Pinguiococcus pyrenoidosus TaxID=172671 RepID=A0A6U0UKY6_9STRA